MHQADNISALYDHEHEGLRLEGKDRVAPDWGADDLFDGRSYPSSRRRFVRERERERDVVDWFVDDADHADERSWSVPSARTFDVPAAGPVARLDPDAPSLDSGARLDPDAPPLGSGGRLGPDAADELASDAAPLDGEPSYEHPSDHLDRHTGAGHPGRRTVTVTGHPDAVRRAERSGEIARRRPNRSLATRVTDRPDRVAMYACALGLLLVLVAIVTANA